MRVREALMTLNANLHDVESTSSSGWEYFDCVKDLGWVLCMPFV